MSIEPWNRLVKLTARAFYDDISLKGENQQKTGRGDNRGMAVVVLDALTRRQWVREEDLAKALKLHAKQLRRTLRFFEEEKLIMRDHRKETAKGAKVFSSAVAATGDGHPSGKEGEEKVKLHTHSYCCLDYAQIFDVVRYRLHRMKKKLKDELESRNTIQEYVCPNCQKRYSALDALQLISYVDGNFHCERCDGEVVPVSDDKLAGEEMGDGDDNARRRKREKLKDTLQRIEDQLKPLTDQLGRVKDLPVPDFGTLQAWEARANAAARANGDSAIDPAKASQGQGYAGTPMPFLGETKVEVALSGMEIKEEGNADNKDKVLKVIPPWMIKEGMSLTKEQRGESSTMKADEDSIAVDDKKMKDVKGEEKSIEDAYLEAYYKALVDRQREQEEASKRAQEESTSDLNGVSEVHEERQVGTKSKREDDGLDDVEWEEAPRSGSGETYKLADLNVEAKESTDEDDEIDWEEG